MPFNEFHLHPDIMTGIKDMGFIRPTPIQTQTIPPMLEGKDLIACAQTGTGKTAAFLIPMLQKFRAGTRGKIRALIVTPTRELAAQIDEQATALGYHTPVRSAAVFGGVGFDPQEKALKAGTDIIVATPGRLLDHMRHGYVKFDDLQILVLDEADRMLDMGFLPDIRRILNHMPAKRQTLLFSATIPPEIANLTRTFMHDPVTIRVGVEITASGIRQAIYPVPHWLKSKLILKLLAADGMDSVLVFVRTKHRADRLTQTLKRKGINASVIHGDKTQGARKLALASFKNGSIQVLVATDIAARGIDVAGISHVINYDTPHDPNDYVHRIGRTARAEAVGDAFTLLSPDEEPLLRDIERLLKRKLPVVTLPDFNYKEMASPEEQMRSQSGGYRGRTQGSSGSGGWRGRRQGSGGSGIQSSRHSSGQSSSGHTGSTQGSSSGSHSGPSGGSRPYGHGQRHA